MTARDELAELLNSNHLYYDTGSHYELSADDAADAILAAGYRKVDVIVEWGAAHTENGLVYNIYRTRDEAQAFVDTMAEVGHGMTIKSREHTSHTITEWEP